MSNTVKYLTVCNKMLNWAVESTWRSYDPFDAGLCTFTKVLPDRGWWVFQHLVRLSPINFRPFLGIRKQVNAKGLAHSMQGCLKLFQVYNQPDMLSTAIKLADWLLKLAVWKGNRCSWNYPFPYITRGLTLRKGTNIVNTSFVAMALLDAYVQSPKKEYLETALGASRFILDDIGYHDYENGRVCFFYAPGATDTLSIHNANMVAANLLYRVGKICNNEGHKELALAAARFTLDYQLPNGLWNYAEKTGFKWIDCFHAGFILDTLMLIANSEGYELCFSAINRGMAGFKGFIHNGGKITHFLNRVYPEDIRSYAQFIKTGVLFSKYNQNYDWLRFSTAAADYVIRTMFSPDGIFYYKRYRYMLIKTPFIRVSIGPMIIALADLIGEVSKRND